MGRGDRVRGGPGRAGPEGGRRRVDGIGRVSALAADIMRKKALDYVVEHINVTGRTVDNRKSPWGEPLMKEFPAMSPAPRLPAPAGGRAA